MGKTKMLQVIDVGSQVVVNDELDARVASIEIAAAHHVRYLCIWWDGRQRRSEWVNDFEISLAPSGRNLSIGFVGENRAS